MIEPDDLDMLAAEYVLGSLPAEERIAVAARRQREPSLDAAIMAWERWLSPLSEFIPEHAPPTDLLSAIEARLAAPPPGLPVSSEAAADVVMLQRQVLRWRRIAAGAIGLAAATLLTFLLRETLLSEVLRSRQATSFVAMLQKDATSPAFVVSVDIATRLMTIRSVAAEKLTGKSYELWLVNPSFTSPKSLGVVREDQRAAAASLATYSPDVVTSSTYAVTLEPEGGSPTGLPTGKVVFSGNLISLDK